MAPDDSTAPLESQRDERPMFSPCSNISDWRAMLAAGLTIGLALAPPITLPSADGARTALLVPVTDALSLMIVEASYREQEDLVDAALTSSEPAGSKIDDPYGVVLWPAAQVVAGAVAALDPELLKGATCVELGAGTGLCSLAALACGAKRALATDYREEPLALLHLSADANEANGLASAQLETALFDIMDEAQPLPLLEDVHLVVAADLLYQKSTSVALARRCVEALRAPQCRAVLVGDLGRPGRQAFLDELVVQGVRPEAATFEQVAGWLPGAPRHDLVSTSNPSTTEAKAVSVGLLQLLASDLDESG